MPAQRQAIAVDLGGTNIRAGLVTEDGELSFHAQVPTPSTAGPGAVLDQIAALVTEVRAQAPGAPAGIAVSAPGPLDTIAGTVFKMQSLAGFEGFPLRAELERRLGAPVAVENDGIAGAIGEWLFGAGQGLTDLLYVTLSTGIGGGIIANGRPLRGRRGLAGHVGHIFFAADWQRHPGGVMSCLEDFASGTALAFRARQEAARHPDTILARQAAVDAAAVFGAAQEGDVAARRLVADEARAVGLGLASLVHVLSPERIVLGGGLATALAVLMPDITATLGRNAKPGFEGTEITPAALGGHSCLYGAAALILHPARAA